MASVTLAQIFNICDNNYQDTKNPQAVVLEPKPIIKQKVGLNIQMIEVYSHPWIKNWNYHIIFSKEYFFLFKYSNDNNFIVSILFDVVQQITNNKGYCIYKKSKNKEYCKNKLLKVINKYFTNVCLEDINGNLKYKRYK